jgi:hypothetical protein
VTSTRPLLLLLLLLGSRLLALHTPRLQRRDTVSSEWDSDAADSFSLSSPSPSSPIALFDEESMMDVDMSEFVVTTLCRNRENDRRSAIPTLSMQQRQGEERHTTPIQQSPQSIKEGVVSSLPTTSTTRQPRQQQQRQRQHIPASTGAAQV